MQYAIINPGQRIRALRLKEFLECNENFAKQIGVEVVLTRQNEKERKK
ncbi:MAG: hypothetical protein ACLRWH_12365 [Emergencia sp.]|nr:hypothetical protein [Emergencia sp.]